MAPSRPGDIAGHGTVSRSGMSAVGGSCIRFND